LYINLAYFVVFVPVFVFGLFYIEPSEGRCDDEGCCEPRSSEIASIIVYLREEAVVIGGSAMLPLKIHISKQICESSPCEKRQEAGSGWRLRKVLARSWRGDRGLTSASATERESTARTRQANSLLRIRCALVLLLVPVSLQCGTDWKSRRHLTNVPTHRERRNKNQPRESNTENCTVHADAPPFVETCCPPQYFLNSSRHLARKTLGHVFFKD